MRRKEAATGRSFVECIDCGLISVPEAHTSATGGAKHDNAAADVDAAFLTLAFERLGRKRSLYMLDFGGGPRWMRERLRRAGHRIIVIDERPPRRPHRDRLTGNLLDLNLVPAQFDLVYTSRAFERVPDPRSVLDELLRLTRTGGLVLIRTDLRAHPVPALREDRHREDGHAGALSERHSYFRRCTFEKALAERADRLVIADARGVVIEVGRRATALASRRLSGRPHENAIERG